MAKEKKDAAVVTAKTKANKIRKLEKHVKKFPSDVAAKAQLKGLQDSSVQLSPRKKPNSKNGWINSMLNNKKLSSNQINTLKDSLRLEKRKFELLETAKYLKTVSKI